MPCSPRLGGGDGGDATVEGSVIPCVGANGVQSRAGISRCDRCHDVRVACGDLPYGGVQVGDRRVDVVDQVLNVCGRVASHVPGGADGHGADTGIHSHLLTVGGHKDGQAEATGDSVDR